MNEKLFQLLKEAKQKDVVDSGSVLIFNDLLKECEKKIKNNTDNIQRLMGQNDQLSLMSAMIYSITQKYVRLQDQADSAQKELDDLKNPEPKKKEEPKKSKPKKKGVEEIG